jgi:hypothetical protein
LIKIARPVVVIKDRAFHALVIKHELEGDHNSIAARKITVERDVGMHAASARRSLTDAPGALAASI